MIIKEEAFLALAKDQFLSSLLSAKETKVKGIFILQDNDGTSRLCNKDMVRSNRFRTEKGYEYLESLGIFILHYNGGTSCLCNKDMVCSDWFSTEKVKEFREKLTPLSEEFLEGIKSQTIFAQDLSSEITCPDDLKRLPIAKGKENLLIFGGKEKYIEAVIEFGGNCISSKDPFLLNFGTGGKFRYGDPCLVEGTLSDKIYSSSFGFHIEIICKNGVKLYFNISRDLRLRQE